MKGMLIAPLALAFSLASSPIAAKEKEITGLELQQIQSHDFEGKKDLVFGAVMSVLQDAGYLIQAADKDTGLITGIGSSKGKLTYNLFGGFGNSKKTPIASVYLEEFGANMTRVRINFVMGKIKSTIYSSSPQDEEPITDAAAYQDAFEKISQAVFLRQSMVAPAPAPAQPAIATTTPAATSN